MRLLRSISSLILLLYWFKSAEEFDWTIGKLTCGKVCCTKLKPRLSKTSLITSVITGLVTEQGEQAKATEFSCDTFHCIAETGTLKRCIATSCVAIAMFPHVDLRPGPTC